MNKHIPFIISCFLIFIIPWAGLTIYPVEYLGSIPQEERWVIMIFVIPWFINWLFLFGFGMILKKESQNNG